MTTWIAIFRRRMQREEEDAQLQAAQRMVTAGGTGSTLLVPPYVLEFALPDGCTPENVFSAAFRAESIEITAREGTRITTVPAHLAGDANPIDFWNHRIDTAERLARRTPEECAEEEAADMVDMANIARQMHAGDGCTIEAE